MVHMSESEISDIINFAMFHQLLRSWVGIVKTNDAADRFNKMCNNSGILLNLKYTDATTQLRWQSLSIL